MLKTKNITHIGILGAMPEEVVNGLKYLSNIKKNIFGDLIIYSGCWKSKNEGKNIYISLTWSGWGKVSASRAAARLLSLNIEGIPSISTIIFSGVAGAANKEIKQWDIIIPSELIQYDMDSSPIFAKFIIPALNQSKLKMNLDLLVWATGTIKTFLKSNLDLPFGNVYNGLIGTGDQFISEEKDLEYLKKQLPALNAIEMEGAAVAQVAIQENISWIIIRVISDNANTSAEKNFREFVENYEQSSWTLINCLLSKWPL